MICSRCRTENRAGRRFCWECGASLQASPCAQCDYENYPHEKFCGGCGQTLDEPGGSSQPQAVADAGFKATYQTADGKAKIAHEAERRHITVLFADLADSTSR